MFLLNVMRKFHQARRMAYAWCCGTKPRYHYERDAPSDTIWEADVPAGGMIIEKITRSIVDEEETRIRVWHAGEHFMQTSNYDGVFTTHAKVPWIWIGGYTIHGSVVSYTDVLGQYLVVGNHIRPSLLEKIDPNVLNWRYMDPVTLEEVDFPTEGITIERYDS
jgi:hypothetical protein